jgi:hypothetical protein
MYFLKSLEDPLSLITQLDAICVVSSLQIKTENFMNDVRNKDEYDDLDEA